MSHNKEHMTSTTDAVRNYIAGASEKEKSEKKGQQQWGLFETNYQRNAKKTTEQSLQEIEQFCEGGVNVNVGGEDWSIGGGGASSFSKCGQCGTVPNGSAKFCVNCGAQLREITTHAAPGSGGFGSASVRTAGGAGSSGFGAGASGKPGNLSFPKGSNAGDAFLQGHLKQDAKKYQPERKW